MKGILLAGGAGTRLFPLTSVASKHFISIYDKPMIYYPLSILMLSGIRDILLISTPHDIPLYQRLFKDGSHLGLNIQYQVQDKPEGIAQAFLLGESFLQDESVCLILGDNIFYGHGLPQTLQKHAKLEEGAVIFGYPVKDPERYGVVQFDKNNKVIGIEEKPVVPKSNYAIPGLYFYDNQVVDITKEIRPSARGELEITDVNKVYLEQEQLSVELMSRGIAWLDTGTPSSLLDAVNYVATVEKRQGLKIACLEEIACRMGYITKSELEVLTHTLPNSEYKQYLQKFMAESLETEGVAVWQ